MAQKQVIALGFFDGVHIGHQALLHACRDLAKQLDCAAAAVTFTTHPDALVIGKMPGLINTPQDRERLLRIFGMDRVISLPFDEQMRSMHWRDFFDLLRREHGAAGLVCGHDFRFGNRGEGNAQLLTQVCEEVGIPCIVVPEQKLDGVTISSTHIRQLIENGELEEAQRFLGHRHILTGHVVTGRQLGHTLGFPTANIQLPEHIVYPRSGVYACRIGIGGISRIAVTNVGNRPTVNGHQIRTESWILDFQGDLYGKELTIEFCTFLRPEQRFGSLEELQNAVEKDAQRTREYFAN